MSKHDRGVTVGDLIRLLSEFPEDTEVLISYDSGAGLLPPRVVKKRRIARFERPPMKCVLLASSDDEMPDEIGSEQPD